MAQSEHLARNDRCSRVLDLAKPVVRHGIRGLPIFRKEPKLKYFNVNTNVLNSYHKSSLYGKVPFTVRVRTTFRAGLFGYVWHLVSFTKSAFVASPKCVAIIMTP